MVVERTPESCLRVQVTRTGPALVCIAVAGELDLDTAGVLAGRVRDALGLIQPDTMLLDLEKLEFIDVAGVRTLYELHAAAAAVDCTLVIRHAPRTTRWILSVLGLDELFALADRRQRHPEPGS
ncbi:STAS domain-containing protein [Paractinoplanes rishiriensis]|uniref:STAS domain-containing protein n=1 Tax=Paractinoplanes rishiriensis TaxID=1050105 RepID=A0A919KDE2_9ACTN|nr:STAS domain-containing protein [Actinoplanes rishiriensis]GIF02327.1 hypothetical protein Ari01nite_97910 [Actinoplanes rishiriensis]